MRLAAKIMLCIATALTAPRVVPVPLTSAGADPRAPALVGAMVAFLEHQPGHMLHSLDMLKFYTAHPGYRVRFLNRA